MKLNQIPVQSGDYELEEMEGELLLYSPRSMRTVQLNETASLIWQLCDGERNIQSMVDDLSASYPDSASQIETDVVQTVFSLVESAALELRQD